MPVIASSAKALRRDRRRAIVNRRLRSRLKVALDAVKAKPTPQTIQAAYSALDRAAKTHIIHRNKAARLKAQAAKLTKVKPAAPTPAKSSKKTATTKKKRASKKKA